MDFKEDFKKEHKELSTEEIETIYDAEIKKLFFGEKIHIDEDFYIYNYCMALKGKGKGKGKINKKEFDAKKDKKIYAIKSAPFENIENYKKRIKEEFENRIERLRKNNIEIAYPKIPENLKIIDYYAKEILKSQEVNIETKCLSFYSEALKLYERNDLSKIYADETEQDFIDRYRILKKISQAKETLEEQTSSKLYKKLYGVFLNGIFEKLYLTRKTYNDFTKQVRTEYKKEIAAEFKRLIKISVSTLSDKRLERFRAYASSVLSKNYKLLKNNMELYLKQTFEKEQPKDKIYYAESKTDYRERRIILNEKYKTMDKKEQSVFRNLVQKKYIDLQESLKTKNKDMDKILLFESEGEYVTRGCYIENEGEKLRNTERDKKIKELINKYKSLQESYKVAIPKVNKEKLQEIEKTVN